MTNVSLDLISPFGNREHATELTGILAGLPAIAAHNLVLTLDATSTAILRTAGLTIAEARPILAALWQQPERITDTDPAAGRLAGRATVPGAERYRVELGERIHVVRRARHLPVTAVAARTRLTVMEVHDLEAGTAWPTLPLLLTLAQALEVPLPLLVDPQATPLRVLRLLAGQYAAA